MTLVYDAITDELTALLNADHKNGGRRIRRFRNLAIWKTGARYFPMTMHKSVDLPPEKGPYLFGYHPHGVLGLGHFFGFACNALGIEEHFPGVFVHGTTLETNFNVPFLRDLILATGMIGAGKQSLNHVLSKKKESVVLVVGGAAEAMDAVPGTNRLTLNKRFGFIKIAIKNGASLVPVFAFGENDIWDQVPNPPGSFVRNFQSLVKKLTGASPVLFYGRFGIIPYRRPVNVVVGMPLAVVKNEEPSDEEVAQVHALYVERLTMLYHAHKDTYLASRTAELIIC
ncbi:diacylglycerol O-acyltransferase 2 [Chytriomyces sp. MP71]|nr:diacylglycerol O-acyltransferase 2 [Chytriomyces sp. MP71]